MRKKITLLMMTALLAVVGVQARMVKTVEFKFTDTDFNVSYTGTNSVNTETGELSLAGNASCAWDRYYSTPKFDLSTSVNFVVKLKEAATQDLYVLINQKGFWETVRVDEGKADDGIGYMGTLKAGDTELKIALVGLKSNMTVHSGTTLDLSNIWMINLWTGGGGGAYTYKIEEVYAEAYAETYDQVIETPVWNKTSFSWDGENNARAEWGEDGMTIDKDNKKITKTTAAWAGNNAVSWLNYTVTDISGYNRLVLELNEASTGPVEVVVSDAGFWGGKCHSAILAAGETELILTLSELKITGTPSGEDTWAKGDPLDLENVNLIFIRTDNGTANQVIDVKDFYFATAEPSKFSLIRENMTADKYGTICLPFAASKPSNATVYDVVGYSEDNDAPKNVYLRTVDALEAGKAYLFKSSDDKDITFIKTGSDANLDSPATPSDGLIGYFDAATRYVPQNSYILVSGKWKKVTKENQNQVGLYRGYLTLSENLKVTPAAARSLGYLEMDMYGSETTGIADVRSKMSDVKGDCYDLQGCKVANPTKGLYIVNGKKVVLK